MSISAIDLGFMYTKSIVDGKRHIMKSVVGQGRKLKFRDLDLGGKTGDDIIFKEEDGNLCFVSDLAIKQSDVVLHSLKDNRFNGEAVDVLMRTALGIGLGSGVHGTSVVSGLPVSHYDIYKDDIIDLFVGDGGKSHYFEIEEDQTMIHKGKVNMFKGKFIPQPFGALLDFLLDDSGQIKDNRIASKTIAVIDPGFGTTDVYVVDALTPIEKLTFSTKVAMNYAYQLIGNKIEQELGKTVALYEIEGVVLTGELRKGGSRYNMQPVIDWAFRMTAEKLVTEISNKWKDEVNGIELIVVSGGGGASLFPTIQEDFTMETILLPDPQWAVVNGYYKWGVRNFA
jgi:plasmid segregation protein ParM